jgi:hypothetical protein
MNVMMCMLPFGIVWDTAIAIEEVENQITDLLSQLVAYRAF